MKTASVRQNTIVFTITATLVILLSLGVYAANRLLTHWLLTKNIEETLARLPAAMTGAQLGGELRNLIATANEHDTRIAPATSVGMRLSGSAQSAAPATTAESAAGSAEAHELDSAPEMSQLLRSVLLNTLAPADILEARIMSQGDLGTLPDESLSRFVAESGLENSFLIETAQELATATGPVTRLQMSYTGALTPRSFVIIPQFDAGRVTGALLLAVDHSKLIASLSLISMVGTGIFTVLCLASFFLAGFLLWMRFHEQVKTNREMEYMAHHDALTGLPNRAVFNARMTEALRLVHAKATNMGVMLIDVDKFKEINDTHGHGTGDIFLQVIADRMRSVFGEHLVARLSGDEFAVMIKSVSDVGRLTKLAAQMIAATKAPCVIDGKEIKISLSIGIARASDGSWRSSRVLHCADLALYRAKHSGRSTFAWYTPEMDSDAQKRKEIEEGLIKALRLDQFQLLFQPQYSLIDNKLKGYESLIRWEHPTKGTISPDVFIPVAEDCGLIEAIGDWVLLHACKEAVTWSDTSLKVAVNVSAAQFKPRITEKKVQQALQESGLEPSRLEIEITESLLIANTEAVVETLSRIHDMGVSIAMDDFGTGYSSLSYLSRFPFDKIKIDRSFIQNLGEDASTDAIVTSIIGLGRSLDVQITAEGVENQDQVTLLRAAGCNLVQGFLFGRPGQIVEGPHQITDISSFTPRLSTPPAPRADEEAAFEEATANLTADEGSWQEEGSAPSSPALDPGEAGSKPKPGQPAQAAQ